MPLFAFIANNVFSDIFACPVANKPGKLTDKFHLENNRSMSDCSLIIHMKLLSANTFVIPFEQSNKLIYLYSFKNLIDSQSNKKSHTILEES